MSSRHTRSFFGVMLAVVFALSAVVVAPASAKLTKHQKAHVRKQLKRAIKKNPKLIRRSTSSRRLRWSTSSCRSRFDLRGTAATASANPNVGDDRPRRVARSALRSISAARSPPRSSSTTRSTAVRWATSTLNDPAARPRRVDRYDVDPAAVELAGVHGVARSRLSTRATGCSGCRHRRGAGTRSRATSARSAAVSDVPTTTGIRSPADPGTSPGFGADDPGRGRSQRRLAASPATASA